MYWAALGPRSGAEQKGRRPVIVVSHDSFNQTPGWQSVIVVPVSSSAAQRRRGPSVVLLPEGCAGLDLASGALCHQITTLDRGKLAVRIGKLPPELLRAVEDGIRAALDMD